MDHTDRSLTELSRMAEAVRLQKPSYVELVFSLVLVWGFGDALSTLFAARFAGHHLESNPLVRFLLAHEPLLVLAMKMGVALLVAVVLLEYRDLVEAVPLWRGWMLALVGAGALVILNNVYVGLLAVAAVV